MNLDDAATQITSSYEQHHEAHTHLRGRWLLLARIVWFALVALPLSVCIASLPEYFTELQTVCRLAACSYGQLSPDMAVALEHFGLSVGGYATFRFGLATLVELVFFGTGGLIFWRKSDDWMALLMACAFVVGGTYPVIWTVGTGHSAWQLPILCVGEMALLSAFLAFTLFPDGRFVPGWTRWLFVVFSIDSAVVLFFTNTFNVFSTTPSWLEVLLVLLFLSLYVGLLIAQIYRYSYVSTLVQRQQTKWVVYGFTPTIAVFAPVLMLAHIFPRSLYLLVFTLVAICITFLYPFTMSFAILRYHLWEIDVLIRRTLVYSCLTALLALLYFGLVIGLQSLVRLFSGQTEPSPVIIVASTLAIVALFQPLRHRLQQLIDRRFYRSKYDAAETVTAFSATLRNEVGLTQLSEQLLAVVQETMQPMHVSLWLVQRESRLARRVEGGAS